VPWIAMNCLHRGAETTLTAWCALTTDYATVNARRPNGSSQ